MGTAAVARASVHLKMALDMRYANSFHAHQLKNSFRSCFCMKKLKKTISTHNTTDFEAKHDLSKLINYDKISIN